MMRLEGRTLISAILVLCSSVAGPLAQPADPQQRNVPEIELFFDAAATDRKKARKALGRLAEVWRDDYAIMIVELVTVLGAGKNQAPIRRLIKFLEKQTGKKFGGEISRWQLWAWSLPYAPHPHYAFFKGVVYGALDQRMRDFFSYGETSTIRLDQVEWGGVKVNGIPPLHHPAHIEATEDGYLDDSDVVIGLSLNGATRAYPRRIVAWHEMVLDNLGGTDVTLVFCSLCGTAIPYESRLNGRLLTFGTSGFLYRSNKLMFDRETGTLWSSLQGVPVIGPLVGSGHRLRSLPVVTTTWGEWKETHPETTVLSLDTGFERDYSEGAAYRDYFAVDELMFPVPERDDRLKNKDVVLVVRLSQGAQTRPVAIASEFLKRNPVYHFEAGSKRYVVLTTPEGASRVFQSGAVEFRGAARGGRVQDSTGRWWRVSEDALRVDGEEEVLTRVSAQQSFWFGWYAQYPETRLLPE